MSRPWFILAGGINGAGKSTFLQGPQIAAAAGTDDEVEAINPDVATLRILAEQPSLSLDEANRQAARECEAMVAGYIREAKRSFAIETVLSTDKYKQPVLDALAAGYGVLFVYVLLGSAEEAIERVKHRVSRGGHDVPEAKIRARWPRTLANMTWFWEHCTRTFVFFNGSRAPEPMLVAVRNEDGETFDPAALAYLLPAA